MTRLFKRRKCIKRAFDIPRADTESLFDIGSRVIHIEFAHTPCRSTDISKSSLNVSVKLFALFERSVVEPEGLSYSWPGIGQPDAVSHNLRPEPAENNSQCS